MKKGEKVFVGVSGGVDSSVALLRLLKQGYEVIAVFIKTWQPDFVECTWKIDRLDAMRVAAHLDVPFLTFDAEQAYKQGVADYMIAEYRAGRTPNPDVMCNEEVKFGVFYDFAMSRGATKIATGHYAQVLEQNGEYSLERGVDSVKDQSYFLWKIKKEQLKNILFPVGDTTKNDTRNEARKAALPTFAKRDSQGICFLGEIDIPDFLSHYISCEHGDVLDEQGTKIGTHSGALLYTVGQRHGFSIQTKGDMSTPYYVVARNIRNNTITVSKIPKECKTAQIILKDTNLFIPEIPSACEAQFRYRQKPFRVQLQKTDTDCAILTVLEEGVEMPSVGQSCVLYDGVKCLGGGIIHEIV